MKRQTNIIFATIHKGLAALVLIATPLVGLAQSGPGPGPFESRGPGCNFFPPSAAVGAGVDPSYFGPPPSQTNISLVGPVQLLRSGPVNFQEGTITLPLYKGYVRARGNSGEATTKAASPSGASIPRPLRDQTDKTRRGGNLQPVWFILTDVSDPQVAASLGLNFSQKLQFSAVGARTGNLDANGAIIFDRGTVDFRPERSVVPGPSSAPFPPASVQPGSVGDRNYSPLVRLENAGGVTYNAPIIAFGVDESQISFPDGNPDYRLVHDQVRKIDPAAGTVTLNLINGFSFGRPVLYVSMDASVPVSAAIEHATLAPLLANLPLGQDDSFSSAVERIFIAVNGPSQNGCDNPQRQGLFATLIDDFRPNNTFGGIPTIALDYSPIWDANLFEFTPEAISNGYRGQLREEFQILDFAERGLVTGAGGGPFGSSGFVINCPIAFRLL
jgi:hypothetical protein